MPPLEIAGPAGTLEAILDEPAVDRAAPAPRRAALGGRHVVWIVDRALGRRRGRARVHARAADPKELVVIDGADHVFDGKVGEVADAVDELLGDW